MECADESTPHEETRIYSSIVEGGNVMQKFEEDDSKELRVDEEQRDRPYPVRSEGRYVAPTNPWPRDLDHRRQGNRWASAASSEAHVASEQLKDESTWGPCESAVKDKRQVQQANKSDGQWSRWASDIRQSQPDQWSNSSSRWHSSAGDERSWRRKSQWEESNWFPPTRKTLKGSAYDTDQEWHLRNMQYGDGWAYDSTQSHYKRAKPTYTDPEDDKMTDSSLPKG